jgi:hypothetical protein
MKRLMSILAAAALFSGSLAMTAYAAKKEEAPVTAYPAKDMATGMKDAPAAITAANLSCTMKNAAYLGSSTSEDKATKKKIKVDAYEVACDSGMGYIVTKNGDGVGQSFDCIEAQAQYDTAVAAKKTGAVHCKLPENANLASMIQPVLTKSGLRCTANNIAFIGSKADAKITGYEIGCSEGGGYLIQVKTDTQTIQSSSSCLQAEVGNYDCKFTPKGAARIAGVAAMANGFDKSCQVANARWVGTAADKHDFYEVACTGKPGFFVEVNNGSPVKSIDCVRAQNIGGGCKMTDMGAAKATAASSYTEVLKTNGVSCTPTDFRVIGKEPRTQRDVVEFKCPEQSAGLLTLIVGAGSTGRFEKMDCFTAKERGLECALTTKAELLTRLTPILVAIEKKCTPTDYRMVGPGETDGDILEVKCSAGEQGYILDLPASRAKTIKTLSCTQAARGLDKCEIPGNS